jgi:hypothetical protein
MNGLRSSRGMSEESYARYFAERELAERSMSDRAADARAAAAHQELAERYEALAVVFGAKPAADGPARS